MRKKLMKKFLSLVTAFSCIFTSSAMYSGVFAWNVEGIRTRIRNESFQEMFDFYYLVVQTIYGSSDSCGDSNFFVYLINQVYEYDCFVMGNNSPYKDKFFILNNSFLDKLLCYRSCTELKTDLIAAKAIYGNSSLIVKSIRHRIESRYAKQSKFKSIKRSKKY